MNATRNHFALRGLNGSTASRRDTKVQSLDGKIPSNGYPLKPDFSRALTPPGPLHPSGYSPYFTNPLPGKKFRAATEEKSLLESEEFDLTVWRVPAIIICTSILWRGDKPGADTRAIRMAPKYIFVTGGVVSSLGK